MKDQYIFPCIITHSTEDGIFYAQFPDIPEAFTDGEDFREVIYNAKDVLGLVLYEREKRGMDIPEANFGMIKTDDNESVSFVEVWMPLVRDRIESKAVKKTLTIPKWLNDLAAENEVNFSQVLQSALKKYLGV